MGRVLKLVNGIARQVDESASPTIYDEIYTAGGTVTTGTPITLPSGKTYDSSELEVWFNTQRLLPSSDYNYVGIVPRTQISFTFDLLSGDIIRFRIDRGA